MMSLKRDSQVQKLTEMLNEQINRNEILEADNLLLETEQRQLLRLLTNRNMEGEKPMNDSTFEYTHDHRQGTRIAHLEQVIAEKDGEMQRLRDYYGDIIDKIEKEAQQSHQRKVMQMQNEQQGIIMKSNEEIRRLSEIVLEGSSKSIIEGKLKSKSDELAKTTQKLQSLQAATQQTLAKMQSDCAKTIADLNAKHANQLELITDAHQHDKEFLKDSFMQETQGFLSEERHEFQNKIRFLESQLEKSTLSFKANVITIQEQCKLIVALEEEVEAVKKLFHSQEQQLKKQKQMLNEKGKAAQELQLKLRAEKQNSQKLSESLKIIEAAVDQKEEKITKSTAQSKKSESNVRKLVAQLSIAQNKLAGVQEEYKNALLELESKNENIARLTLKLSREGQRKDKLLSEQKQAIKQLEESVAQYEQQKYDADAMYRQGEEDKKKTVKLFNEQIGKINEMNTQLTQENKRIKAELAKFEERMKGMIGGIQTANHELEGEIARLKDSLGACSAERETFRKLYETTKQEHLKLKESADKIERKNNSLVSNIENCQQEMAYLRQQIANSQLTPSQKQELEAIRHENADLKTKISVIQDSSQRYKQEAEELSDDILTLNEQNMKTRASLEKMQLQLKALKEEKNTLEIKLKQTELDLKQRSQRLQNELPYMNTLLEEKKLLEGEVQKLTNENTRKTHLLDVAKRARAEEVVNLQKEIEENRKKDGRTDRELREAKQALQRLNREKVSLLRGNTATEDTIRKLEKENMFLKDQMKRLQDALDACEQQMELAYKVIRETANDGEY